MAANTFDNQYYDMERAKWLQARGFKLLRFWNHEVLQQTVPTLEAILRALSSQ